MKKLFFIAFFAIGLTTTNAQSYVSDLDEPASWIVNYTSNDWHVDLSDMTNPIVSVDVNGTEYSETITYYYPIGSGLTLSDTEVYVGSDVYHFIVEWGTSFNITYVEIWIE